MSNYIASVIDLIQEKNESIVSHRSIKAPCLSDYPPTTDSARCPIMLTYSEGANFGRLNADNLTIDLVSLMLFKPLGQGHFGDTMLKIHQVMDDVFAHYTDEDNYIVTGALVLQLKPITAAIVSGVNAFRMSGYQLIEYPLQSGMAYHGFEMRYQVETNLASDCE